MTDTCNKIAELSPITLEMIFCKTKSAMVTIFSAQVQEANDEKKPNDRDTFFKSLFNKSNMKVINSELKRMFACYEIEGGSEKDCYTNDEKKEINWDENFDYHLMKTANQSFTKCQIILMYIYHLEPTLPVLEKMVQLPQLVCSEQLNEGIFVICKINDNPNKEGLRGIFNNDMELNISELSVDAKVAEIWSRKEFYRFILENTRLTDYPEIILGRNCSHYLLNDVVKGNSFKYNQDMFLQCKMSDIIFCHAVKKAIIEIANVNNTNLTEYHSQRSSTIRNTQDNENTYNTKDYVIANTETKTCMPYLVVKRGHDDALKFVEENITTIPYENEKKGTMYKLIKTLTCLRNSKQNMPCDDGFCKSSSLICCCDADEIRNMSILQLYSAKHKSISLNGNNGLTDTEIKEELSARLLVLVLCASVAYNFIYVIPNKIKLSTSRTLKRSIVYLLNVILITISSKHLQIDYNHNVKSETFDKIPKCAIYKAFDILQNRKNKSDKELLYDIIHYDSVNRSEFIQVYPVVRGDLSNELIRVGTLSSFPDESCPSLIRLAESGFYYEGKGRELKCFSCGLTYGDWVSTTLPLDIHHQLSPECPYVKQRLQILAAKTANQPNIEADSSGSRGLCTDSNSNVPALLTSSSALPVTVTNGLGIDSLFGRSSDISSRQTSNNSVVTSSSRSSGYSSGYGSQSSSGYSSGNISQGSSGYSSGNISQGSSGYSSGNTSQGSSGYSSGYSSSSQTGSSNGILGSQSQLAAVTEGDEQQTSESNSLRDNNIQPDSNRNIPREKYPEYKRRETRLSTYKTWPSHLTFLYPQDLTECGFFYSNFGDCVRCFQCGIGLRNWEHDDNPWVEHARWSRKCSYLLQRKGQGFIDSVLSVLGLQTDAEIEEQVLNSTLDRSSQSTSGSSASNDVRDPITHPAAQYVINEQIFGTNVDRLVKKAMNQLIQAYDWENITNDMLVNAMCEYKDGVEFMETRTDVDTEVQPQLNDMTNIPASSTPRSTETNASSRSSASVGTDPENVQKENEELKDLYTCKICLDERVGITFVPCGHLVTCKTCSPKIRRCPLCRTFIRGTIKTVV